MRRVATPLSLLLTAVSSLFAQTVPADVSALVAKARLATPSAWCRGEFQSSRSGAYAVAIPSTSNGGRYLVVEADGTSQFLGPFARRPDLSCYTPVEARNLNAAIGRSDTLSGQISPRWSTTVVCAFVEDTMAVCWQYSPAERTFVKVGGWET